MTTTGNNDLGQLGKPGTIVGMLTLSVILMVIVFGYHATLSSYDKEYINITDNQRVRLLQILNHATEASKAKVEAFASLQDINFDFENALNQLINGNSDTGLPASPTEATPVLLSLNDKWPAFNSNVQSVLREEGVIRMLREYVFAINQVMPDITTATEAVAKDLLDQGISPEEIYVASRQLLLAQRITTNVNQIIQSQQTDSSITRSVQSDIAEYASVINSMLRGNGSAAIKRVNNNKIRAKLNEIKPMFETLQELSIRILEKAPQLFRAQMAANELYGQADNMMKDIVRLLDVYKQISDNRKLVSYIGYALAALSLGLLILLGFVLTRSTREQLNREAATNEKTQRAILRLLDEISPVADGDLTVRATVSEEITGAIADSINYTVEALRSLVASIHTMSHQVTDTAGETLATAIHLSRASDNQSKQIESIGQSMEQMAHAIAVVSKNAQSSSQVASQSVHIAEKGAVAVKNMVSSMNTIRDDIKETSSRIKRLGESSQEIGDIVELINDIADQTNILAINAAIHTSGNTQQGEDFTAVADEIQQLAERVGQATQKIETLIRSMQLDTNKAVESMEQSTADVLDGMHLAESAGEALLKIEAVSSYLAELIHAISNASRELASGAGNINQHMNSIRNITSQNLAGTKRTAALTDQLRDLAYEQQQRIRGFKLAEENTAMLPDAEQKTDAKKPEPLNLQSEKTQAVEA